MATEVVEEKEKEKKKHRERNRERERNLNERVKSQTFFEFRDRFKM